MTLLCSILLFCRGQDKDLFFLGGIPLYNRLIIETKSVKENIIDLIASDGARLENEVLMYLKLEISKIANVNEVIVSLAKGYSKNSDILS